MKSRQKIVAIGAASGVILMSATVWILTRILCLVPAQPCVAQPRDREVPHAC